MEDTDSMAIIATEHGGLFPCPGGPHRLEDGREAILALSWEQVADLSRRFDALKPYDPAAVTDHILKIEPDNFDPITGKQRQLWCLAISAKRYALFLRDEHGEPELLRRDVNNKKDRWSEHGLGHLLNPTDPGSEDREWIAQAWLGIIRRRLGLPTQPLGFEARPAVGTVTVSSPAVLKPMEALNAGKGYADQVKPFNFVLSCHVMPLGHPIGANPTRFHLIAPYEKDPRKWSKIEWIDQYTGQRYRIATYGAHGGRRIARVKTYGDVLREYETHPEAKCADSNGKVCGKQTVGLLQRRHIALDRTTYIGKESNLLDDVESGFIPDAQSAYTEYSDPRRDDWATRCLPALRKMPLSELQRLSGMSRAALQQIRAGRRPHPRNKVRLQGIAMKPLSHA